MKSIKVMMIAAFAILSLAGFSQESNPKSSKKKGANTEKVKYECPMHPEESAGKPGKCTKCKMDLKEVKQDSKVFTCPMHPEETSNKPGKCAKCKMDLKEVKQESKAYSCPMHPDETSNKPGKCAKCKMDLVEKKDDHSGHNH